MRARGGARPGIIPARAGFTRALRGGETEMKDHPRSRGVYWKASPPRASRPGSSPLARGLPTIGSRRRARRGIIPARAGFTAGPSTSTRPGWDHPRSRGVYSGCESARCPMWGSSPLARGLHRPHAHGPLRGRIIPARAGFTLAGHVGATRHRDHPRSRGVYDEAGDEAIPQNGSSPLARGLHFVNLTPHALYGIIPARAGFTHTHSDACTPRADHPRSRGVYPRSAGPRSSRSGSSPLARGLPAGR